MRIYLHEYGTDPSQDERRRYNDILSAALHPECYLVSVRDIKEVITGQNLGNQEQQEQDALARLLTGYEDTTAGDVAAAFAEHATERRPWTQICVAATQRHRQHNITEWLISIDKALEQAAASDRIEHYMQYVIRAIENLRFIIHWNTQTRLRGGKRWKVDYRDRLFEDKQAAALASLQRTFIGEHLAREIKRLRDRFNRRHEKTITSRNQFMQLYYTVSISECLSVSDVLESPASLVRLSSWTRPGT